MVQCEIFSLVKETTKIKMSLIPFTFNKVALQVVTVDGKEWAQAKEVCKVLEYKKDISDVIPRHCICGRKYHP